MSESKLFLSANDPRTLIIRTGFILKQLRRKVHELGFEETIADVASGIPDARARLGYVVTMTEKAACEVINSVELTQPCQSQLKENAGNLLKRWEAIAEESINDPVAIILTEDTRAWLGTVPQLTGFTRQQLQSIMMAQGFQDLTGQIIQRMMKVLNELEQNMVEVLKDNIKVQPIVQVTNISKGKALDSGSTSQDNVDDLLTSLGL